MADSRSMASGGNGREKQGMKMDYQLVLASASPRRREILSQAGLVYTVIPSEFEERGICADEPAEYVKTLAGGKAREVYGRLRGQSAGRGFAEPDEERRKKPLIVLGADTVVACDGLLLNKPRDRADAAGMLSRLQGRAHEVYAGVALCCEREDGGELFHSFAVRTEVHFYPMSPEEIERYLDCGEYTDKAGAYAIQGRSAVYIREIRGDYYNVVGLPLAAVLQELKGLGVEML